MDIPAREASVCKTSNVVSQTSTHDQTGRLEHLRHTRAALRSKIPENNNRLLTLLDRVGLNGSHELILRVEDASFALELKTLLSGDLGDCTTRGEITAQDAD
jgi:hypothetical protein